MVSDHNVQIHSLIVAAGKGSRFGANIAKQYITLNGQTLLQHSVAKLASSHYLNNCLIVIANDDDIAESLSFALPVRFTIGGVERWQSVKAGINKLIEEGADPEDLVVIHDAARPAVPTRDIDEVIEAAQLERYGAILATPVADTLKLQIIQPASEVTCQSLKEQPAIYVDRTIDRRGLWQAQTPQVFRLGVLASVLDYVAEKQLQITDEASAFEALSYPIRMIRGSRRNIKMTYPEDLAIIKAFLNEVD